MTEDEAKIFIQNAMEQSKNVLAELMLIMPKVFAAKRKSLGEYYSNLENCKKEIQSCEVAIKALKEVQQYRALEKRLTDMFGGELSLEDVTEELERYLKEPDNPHPVNAKILTYEDAKTWGEYKAIGTVEELRTMKEHGGFSGIELAEIAVALTEFKEYQQIGTLEECRAAMEKQKPFKPETTGLTVGIGRCKCGVEFLDRKTNYCGNCGQKLNWNRRVNDETD